MNRSLNANWRLNNYYNNETQLQHDSDDDNSTQPGTFDHTMTRRIVAYELYRYLFPVILVLGTTGNCLSMLVLRRRAMRRGCSSVYLTSLAAVDTIVLYVSGFKTWIRVQTQFELMHVSDVMCRLVKYSFFSSTHLAAWIVVAVTIERFLIVVAPLKATQYLPVRRPGLVVAVIGFVVLAFNSNIAWASELVYDNGIPYCLAYEHKTFVCSIFPKLNLLIYAVLPSLIVATLNTAIVVTVARSNRQTNTTGLQSDANSSLHYSTSQCCVADRNRQRPPAVRQSSSSTSTTATASHTSSRSPPGGDTTSMGSRSYRHGQQQRLTLTLVTISTLWMLLSLPYALVENEGGIFKFEVAPITRIVCYLLMYSNHAVNFFVYCLLGRKFRTELKRAFGFDKYARRSAALADGRRVLRQSSWQPTFSHQHNTFMPCCCLVSRDRERHKQGLDEAVRDVSALAPGINGSNKSDGNKHPL